MKYGKPSSIEEHQNESKWMTWKTQMIRNVPKLQKVNWSDVVVGKVGTTTLEILAAALFVIHVAIEGISFKSIAKCSIVNEIIKSTNLKHHMLLS
jgi:tetrahydromethanopterin S-methyltransferase subunit H